MLTPIVYRYNIGFEDYLLEWSLTAAEHLEISVSPPNGGVSVVIGQNNSI